MPVRFLVLHCGYIEEACISPLCYHYEGEEKLTARKAIENFSHGIFQKFLDDTRYGRESTRYPGKCCLAASTDLEKKFCPVCGSRLKNVGLNFDQVAQFIHSLSGRTADGYGEEVNFWSPWFQVSDMLGRKREVLEIGDCAEKVLIHLLDPAKIDAVHQASLLRWKKENYLKLSDYLDC